MTIPATFSPNTKAQTLDEGFNPFSLESLTGPHALWCPNTTGNIRSVGPNGHFLNHELEWYGSPGDPGLVGYTYDKPSDTYGTQWPQTKLGPKDLGLNPFDHAADGALAITASLLKPDPLTCNKSYLSGYISTHNSHQQFFGSYELMAWLPQGAGLWPAFWLLPSHGWPPEIDIFEVLGKERNTVHATVHANSLKTAIHPYNWDSYAVKSSFDPYGGYHLYQFSFDAKDMVWYLDGHEVWRQPTPPDVAKTAWYSIINLAVGSPKDWGGGPTPMTHFPATMKVKHLKVWGP